MSHPDPAKLQIFSGVFLYFALTLLPTAYTPSALALVGDVAGVHTPRAYAWHSTAHYAAIAFGPFLGALVLEWWGYRAAFLSGAAVLALALGMALSPVLPERRVFDHRSNAIPLTVVMRDLHIWAGWGAGASGMLLQGIVFTFLPLVVVEHGLTATAIGTIFLALGLANTVARAPAGWLIDRIAGPRVVATAGLLAAAIVTTVIPHAKNGWRSWLGFSVASAASRSLA